MSEGFETKGQHGKRCAETVWCKGAQKGEPGPGGGGGPWRRTPSHGGLQRLHGGRQAAGGSSTKGLACLRSLTAPPSLLPLLPICTFSCSDFALRSSLMTPCRARSVNKYVCVS
jgi:hypothetical protein